MRVLDVGHVACRTKGLVGPHLPYLGIRIRMPAFGLTCAFALLLRPLGGAAAPVHVLQPEDLEAETSRAGDPRTGGQRRHAGLLDGDRHMDRGHDEQHGTGARLTRAKCGLVPVAADPSPARARHPPHSRPTPAGPGSADRQTSPPPSPILVPTPHHHAASVGAAQMASTRSSAPLRELTAGGRGGGTLRPGA